MLALIHSKCAILALLLLTASCAAPKLQPRAQLAPPLQLERPAMTVDRMAAQAGRADRDQSKAATQASPSTWLGRDDGFLPARPTYRTITEEVEVPVEVPVEIETAQPRVALSRGSRQYYSTYDDYLYSRRAYRPSRGSQFPVNTVVGAGLGAIIGHQRGRRDRGALIGGSIGLLFDLNRW